MFTDTTQTHSKKEKTMNKDINVMFQDSLDIMTELNIEVETISSVTWNNRLKAVWGRCIHNRRNNTYRIELNTILKNDEVSWDAAMNTMIHEVLHAHKDRFCHTGEWKRCAQRINREYECYHIERTTSPEAKNVADKIGRTYKYIVKCTNCGAVSKYKTNGRIVKLIRSCPGSCRCRCGCTNLVLETLR